MALYNPNYAVSAYYTGAGPTGTLTTSFNTTTYGTKVIDTHSAYASGTYTVPYTGYYDVSAAIGLNGTHVLNTIVQVSMHVGGVEKITNVIYAGGAATSLFPQISVQAYPLTAGDLVTIKSYSGATSPTFTASAPQNWFSISRVR